LREHSTTKAKIEEDINSKDLENDRDSGMYMECNFHEILVESNDVADDKSMIKMEEKKK
jgi:hypothetical protein